MDFEVSAGQVKAMMKQGEKFTLLDVREPSEHAYCRLPDSVLIPLGELPHHVADVEPPAGATVVVYCHHGIRSLGAAGLLQSLGFRSVRSLEGGIEEWASAIDPGLPRY